MDKLSIQIAERSNTGTSWTYNKFFEDNGFLVIRNLWDPKELVSPVPQKSGQYNYWGRRDDQYNLIPVENQVNGSSSRYWHPQYREIHSGIRLKLEEIIGRSLYNTYYYDRFYYPGQKLDKHVDRSACEISVTVHVGTNLKEKDKDWAIWVKAPDIYTDNTKREVVFEGKDIPLILQPGDGMIYKGCERPHWRDPMPGKKLGLFNKKRYYYHQIFFHYVLQDGMRAHCAWDSSH